MSSLTQKFAENDERYWGVSLAANAYHAFHDRWAVGGDLRLLSTSLTSLTDFGFSPGVRYCVTPEREVSFLLQTNAPFDYLDDEQSGNWVVGARLYSAVAVALSSGVAFEAGIDGRYQSDVGLDTEAVDLFTAAARVGLQFSIGSFASQE